MHRPSGLSSLNPSIKERQDLPVVPNLPLQEQAQPMASLNSDTTAVLESRAAATCDVCPCAISLKLFRLQTFMVHWYRTSLLRSA